MKEKENAKETDKQFNDKILKCLKENLSINAYVTSDIDWNDYLRIELLCKNKLVSKIEVELPSH